MRSIYLDHNSTTPMLPAVAEAMRPYWTEAFGNPASAHHAGRDARKALELARQEIAALLGAAEDEVVFTSGGTEANNLAISGLCRAPGGHIVVSPIEHPSVAEPIAQLAKRKFPVSRLRVDPSGVAVADDLASVVRPDTRLVTVMLANNETGAIQPVAELVERCRAQYLPPLFHCDAVQAVGKIPVHFSQLGVATLSLSAHKFNGPKGIGALLVRRKLQMRSLFLGGHQQQGRRPGTEPVALAVGVAKALSLACQEREARRETILGLRRRLLEKLERTASPMVLNGSSEGLPNTLNISFPGCSADVLLMKLDLAGIACSTGSACSSGSLLPSPVLQAMGCPPEVLHSAMRFSLSHLNTEEEIDAVAERIAAAVRQLRERQTGDETLDPPASSAYH